MQKDAKALLKSISNLDEQTFLSALDREAERRLTLFNEGVHRYQTHPYRRHEKQRPVLWQDGSSRLLDYSGAKDGPVVLMVPSLINKAYVLDLKEGRSLTEALSKAGCTPFMLDWGEPGPAEEGMDLESYILGRLKTAIDVLARQTCRKVHLVGYCMGGTMSAGLVCLAPENVASLTLLATPWDFHAGRFGQLRNLQGVPSLIPAFINKDSSLCADVIQSLFIMLDPFAGLNKFCQFAELDSDSEEEEVFVAIEDWNNDGIALNANVARTCLLDWYIANLPMKGTWQMAGETVDPRFIDLPVSLFVAARDRIVSPESSLGFLQKAASSKVFEVSCGHVGMICGRQAETGLYRPLAGWIKEQENACF